MKAHAATALRWLDFPLATLRWLLRDSADTPPAEEERA